MNLRKVCILGLSMVLMSWGFTSQAHAQTTWQTSITVTNETSGSTLQDLYLYPDDAGDAADGGTGGPADGGNSGVGDGASYCLLLTVTWPIGVASNTGMVPVPLTIDLSGGGAPMDPTGTTCASYPNVNATFWIEDDNLDAGSFVAYDLNTLAPILNYTAVADNSFVGSGALVYQGDSSGAPSSGSGGGGTTQGATYQGIWNTTAIVGQCINGVAQLTYQCMLNGVVDPTSNSCDPGLFATLQLPSSESCVNYSWVASTTACSATCGGGSQTTSYTCTGTDGSTDSTGNSCGTPQPVSTTAPCNTQACPTKTPCTYSWSQSGFGSCQFANNVCGSGTQTQTVSCISSQTGKAVANSKCSGRTPPSSQGCNVACTPQNYIQIYENDVNADNDLTKGAKAHLLEAGNHLSQDLLEQSKGKREICSVIDRIEGKIEHLELTRIVGQCRLHKTKKATVRGIAASEGNKLVSDLENLYDSVEPLCQAARHKCGWREWDRNWFPGRADCFFR
jgi:hypothetical protein